MKTLVLIASHMRTFSRCLPTQYHHVYKHLPDPTFVVYTVNDKDAQSALELEKYYPKEKVIVGAINEQPELPIPVKPTAPDWTIGRMYTHEPYAISVHPQAVLRQLWQMQKGWEFAAGFGNFATVGAFLDQFDIFVRIRPDCWFRDVRLPEMKVVRAKPGEENNPDFTRSMVDEAEAKTPWWGRFGGVNDRFAILGRKAAEVYFTTYSRIPELVSNGCPLHPESLVRSSLEEAGCTIDDRLYAMFSKLYPLDHPEHRLRGTFRDPEILSEDVAKLAIGG